MAMTSRQLMLVEIHKLWMHHAQLLMDNRQCKDVPVDCIADDAKPMFKPRQTVMVTHHARHTFEAKYLADYRVLCQVNEHTLLL